MNLVEGLGIQKGITAVIGGGGKTSLLRTLGEALSVWHQVLLCTTTRMYPYSDLPLAVCAEELHRMQAQHNLICVGTPVPGTGKITAPDLPFSVLLKHFAYILIEADGAARRPLKAHAPHEPVVPAETGQVVMVVGASGFGQPIRDVAHRPELYAQLAGVDVDAPASPETESAVLTAEALHDRIFVNQVETSETVEAARHLASLTRCPTLAGSLWEGVYFRC